jgi:glycyl-tRNA synthetase
MNEQPSLDIVISLCKRRGFVYPSAEIYGGLNGVYDIGHLGALMKDNIRAAWKKAMIASGFDILFLEGSLLGPHAMWNASGHVQNFHDPMIDCLSCKKRYRADDLDQTKGCPSCGNRRWTDVRQFNMMFTTHVGAAEDSGSIAYLRPETAQSVFVDFKHMLSTNRVKIPFGIAQIGKAFRNEITPKQFLFRMREFEQMELEFFCKPEDSAAYFQRWCDMRRQFFTDIGIHASRIRLRDHHTSELAHYSTRCTDVEYEFPFGFKEIEGIAHRGDFDLTQHTTHSGKDLSVFDEETKTSYTPHVVECSVGTDRLFLTLLFDAYDQDNAGQEERVVLRLAPSIAPVKAAFFPLVKKLSEPLYKLYQDIKKCGIVVEFDDAGSIGKRYRRHDEIGTPLCFTYDFDSELDASVTVRDRDTLEQIRIPMQHVAQRICSGLS